SRRPPHDVGRRNLLSRSFQPRADAIGHLAAGADVPGGGRQDLQEGLAVVAAENPVVEDGDRAAVGRAPDQAAESLLQAQRSWRCEVNSASVRPPTRRATEAMSSSTAPSNPSSSGGGRSVGRQTRAW